MYVCYPIPSHPMVGKVLFSDFFIYNIHVIQNSKESSM